MPFLQVDLKVMEVYAPAVARATGISEDRVLGCLLRVWHRCWSTAQATLQRDELLGSIGPDRFEDLVGAFCVDFLEKQEDGAFRVRGADQYLRIKEARRRGAEATNRAKRATLERRLSDAAVTQNDALTPNTEHRTPNKETTMSSSSELDLGVSPETPPPTKPEDLEAKLTEAEWQVFEHWRVMLKHPKAKATPERKKLIAKALKTYSVAELQRAISGVTKSPHHMGQNDRNTRYDDLGLILRDAAHVEGFMRLVGGA